MTLSTAPRHHRFPVSAISQTIWIYHHFGNNYRHIKKQLGFWGVGVSRNTIRTWRIRFSNHFWDVIKKRKRKPYGKWCLNEITVKVNGKLSILWRAVDFKGYELDASLQKHRNKKAATWFLSRLLESYPAPRPIVTDKPKSHDKLIKAICHQIEYQTYKWLNARVGNAHQPNHRKGKCLIRFKPPVGTQIILFVLVKFHNFFAVYVGCHTEKASERKIVFAVTYTTWFGMPRQLFLYLNSPAFYHSGSETKCIFKNITQKIIDLRDKGCKLLCFRDNTLKLKERSYHKSFYKRRLQKVFLGCYLRMGEYFAVSADDFIK